MATEDDKQIPEPDPWAGLEAGGAEDEPAGSPFAFEELEDEAVAEDIPLVVFPPPDGETAGSEVLIGTGHSGIISMSDAAESSGQEDLDDGAAVDEPFDDGDIAHELGLSNPGLSNPGLSDAEGDAIAAAALSADEDLDDAADFGASDDEPPSDEMSFNAGLTDNASPLPDSEQVDPVVDQAESWPDDLASIPIASAVGAAGVATSAALAMEGDRQAAAKKKGGGLGQMVGVVLGGLMALPITYAILIWGFQKDPFKLGKQVPQQLAFLLPQKLQPGSKPARKASAGPSLDAAPSLDDLPSADESMPPASEVAAALSESEPAEPVEAAGSAETAEPASMKTEDMVVDPAEPSEPAESAGAAAAVADESESTAVAAAPLMASDTALAVAVPKSDALPDIDALMDDAGTAAVATVPSARPAELPPLDLTEVETAAERAAEALDALDAVVDPLSPDRDRLLVSWYRRLATLGEELVRLETIAADSGRPLSPTPASAAGLLDRIRDSDTAVADLDRLGGMWLTSQKRRADGVALVVTLGGSRRVGPYWSTRVSVSGGQTDGADRGMAIISRSAPSAEIGERVVVSGVMFDGDAVWAAEMRPVAVQPPSAGELE